MLPRHPSHPPITLPTMAPAWMATRNPSPCSLRTSRSSSSSVSVGLGIAPRAARGRAPPRTPRRGTAESRPPRWAPGPRSSCRLRLIDMLRTCSYLRHMPRMIQLRHVPDDLHRRLKARAALEGLSLSDYLLREVRRVAERPTLAELRYRLAPRTPGVTPVPPPTAPGAGRGRTGSWSTPP